MGRELTLILLLAAVYGAREAKGFPNPTPPPATEEFCGALPEEAINTTVACIEKLNIKEIDLERFSADGGKSVDANFDDQCLAKCVFVESGLMNEDGTPIAEAFQADFKKFHSEKYHQFLSEITTTCMTLAETQFSSSGGAKGNACKYAATLAQCFATAEFKICNPDDGSKSKST